VCAAAARVGCGGSCLLDCSPTVAGRISLCVCVALVTAGCGTTKHSRVPLPPVSAGPQHVVRAYLAALNAHDTRTARSLLTPGFAMTVETNVDSWFRNVRSITHVRVNRPTIERDGQSLRAVVGVHFVLDQYKVESMENGPTDWGYSLVRTSSKRRWLISGEGLG
jgi:hypothetical protein